MIFIIGSTTFGMSYVWKALLTSSVVPSVDLYQSLFDVRNHCPLTGLMAPWSITICGPPEMPALFNMARVAALIIRWGIWTCSATPIPAQYPVRRIHGTE